MTEYKALSKEKWVNVEVGCRRCCHAGNLFEGRLTIHLKLDHDNVFNWNIALIVINPDSYYYGGYFKAKMTFPRNYPYSPPGTPPLT